MEMKEDKFHCYVCSVKCSGVEPYMQHMSSAKHKKKVEQGKMNATLGSDKSNFFCDACNVPCSGVVPYQQHITSDKHLKKVQTFKFLSEKNVSLDEPDHAKSAMNSSELAEGVVAKRREGDSLASKASRSFTYLLPVASQNSYKCDVCDTCFTGPVPYQIHMESPIHKKNLKKAEVLSKLNARMGELYGTSECSTVLDNDVSSTSINNASEVSVAVQNLSKIGSAHTMPDYFCSVCCKQCTGPAPFQQHIDSSSHEKNVRRKELLGHKIEVNLISGNIKTAVSPNKIKTAVSPNKIQCVRDMTMNFPLAECYVCNMKLYSHTEVQEHYDSAVHHDNQNIFDYKRKVRVFSPDEPFDLKG